MGIRRDEFYNSHLLLMYRKLAGDAAFPIPFGTFRLQITCQGQHALVFTNSEANVTGIVLYHLDHGKGWVHWKLTKALQSFILTVDHQRRPEYTYCNRRRKSSSTKW
jgi:hypothetical protein